MVHEPPDGVGGVTGGTSLIVAMAVAGVPTVAPVADRIRICKVSSDSTTESVRVVTEICFEVSPTANVSEPVAAA